MWGLIVMSPHAFYLVFNFSWGYVGLAIHLIISFLVADARDGILAGVFFQ